MTDIIFLCGMLLGFAIVSGGALLFASYILHRYLLARARGEEVEPWGYFLCTSGLLMLALLIVAGVTGAFGILVAALLFV